MAVRISVVVPVYNSARYLPTCISSLLAQTYPPEQYEIIIVDNNSTDGSLEIAASFPKVKLTAAATQGAYAARNHGVSVAAGSILAFTDSDCAVAADWLRRIECAMRSPEVQVVLGERLPPRDSAILSTWFDCERAMAEHVFQNQRSALYFGYTNNMGVQREAFDRFGPFLERSRGSDTVFVWRVGAALPLGSVVYRSGVRVTHLELDRFSKLLKKRFLYGRSEGANRHLIAKRQFTVSERLRLYWRTIRENHYGVARSALLLGMLSCGRVAWRTGLILGKVRGLGHLR